MTPLRERVAAAIWEAQFNAHPLISWSRLITLQGSAFRKDCENTLRQADAAIAECEKGRE